MFKKFLPRTNSFFDDFDKHAAIVAQSTQELLAMVSTGTDLIKRAERITLLEKEADLIAHHCIRALHKTFITPFEREDIYKIITQLDDIIDTIEDISARIILYKITTMTAPAKNLTIVLGSAAQEVQRMVMGLRKLDNIDAMFQMFARIHDFEHEADHILRTSLAELFAEEKDPFTLIKWKELYELLEAATDGCQKIANTAEGVIIEHT